MAALYRQTWPRLIGVLVSIGGSPDDAEAVAQDAYVKLLGRWDAIRRYDDPEAWVRALAVRTMISRLGRRTVTRAVVVLHDVLELPVEQIAEELQLATRTVESRLARAERLPTELAEYVDQCTPNEAPPVEDVVQAVKERRRRRYVLSAAVVAVVVVAGIAAGLSLPRAETEPTIGLEMPAYLVDGPAPQQYKLGTTVVLLRGEIAVTSARVDPDHLSELIVGVEPDEVPIEPCLPNTVVRILSQDAYSVRIAAYRYGIDADQNDGHQCTSPGPAPTTLQLDLQSAVGNRTVYAGSDGERVVLKGRSCLKPAGSFAARCR
jgi:hypothetical protein